MQIAHGAPGLIVPGGAFAAGVLPIAGRAPAGSGTSSLICRRYLPSLSNTSMRTLPRLATYTLPCASVAMLCGVFSWPGPLPGSPKLFTQSPFLSYFATREFT